MIIYGTTNKSIVQQKQCTHNWHGPCTDSWGEYMVCLKCMAYHRAQITEYQLLPGEEFGDHHE